MDTGVKRVWGKCNNVDVVFTKNDRGLWDVVVPPPINFTYILEIWAEDNAGNIGYLATVRVTISRDSLHVSSIDILKIGSSFSIEAVTEIFGHVETTFINGEISSKELGSSIIKSNTINTEFIS